MDDTSPEIAQKVREMIQAKSPVERLLMGCSMGDAARYLVINAILRENPNISDAALRQELFLRYYRDDFTLEQREKILAYLGKNNTPISRDKYL